MKFNSFLNHQKYNRQRPCLRADAKAMGNKGNVVLYLDRELVAKSKSLGFNLSKTFENHLKHLKPSIQRATHQTTLIQQEKTVSGGPSRT
jgi:hypothetical protein